MSEIEPFSTIHSPQDKRSVAVPLPINDDNEDDPRLLAHNALDTLDYGTETPERQTPPTNYTVVTEESPPTDPELEPEDAEPLEIDNELPPEGEEPEVVNLTPDVQPTQVWSGQPRVQGQVRPERDERTHAIAHERVPVEDEDDDENEWVEDAKPKAKRGRPKKK